jgi:hypothetical protein
MSLHSLFTVSTIWFFVRSMTSSRSCSHHSRSLSNNFNSPANHTCSCSRRGSACPDAHHVVSTARVAVTTSASARVLPSVSDNSRSKFRIRFSRGPQSCSRNPTRLSNWATHSCSSWHVALPNADTNAAAFHTHRQFLRRVRTRDPQGQPQQPYVLFRTQPPVHVPALPLQRPSLRAPCSLRGSHCHIRMLLHVVVSQGRLRLAPMPGEKVRTIKLVCQTACAPELNAQAVCVGGGRGSERSASVRTTPSINTVLEKSPADARCALLDMPEFSLCTVYFTFGCLECVARLLLCA